MLVNLSHRSNEEELMDHPEVDSEDLNVALSDISRVNKWLGGNNITIQAVLNQINQKGTTGTTKEWTIIDLGCGDGEMLRQVTDIFRRKKIKAKLIGIDNNHNCIVQANKLSHSYKEIEFYSRDILTLKKDEFNCDIIICTLTLHHFKDYQIKKVLQKSMELISGVLIINDLHRNKLAYYLFKIFSFFFIKGHIAKNDGLVSIKRGFKRKELIHYAKELQLKSYRLKWKWAFRYCWIISN
ncbi:methyltransferase domain-containing protein [Aquimarina sp. M1]